MHDTGIPGRRGSRQPQVPAVPTPIDSEPIISMVTVAELAEALPDAHLVPGAQSRNRAVSPVQVQEVIHDSRLATAGSCFVALQGMATDGHGHVDEAVANGAIAALVMHTVDTEVPQIVVADTRIAAGPAAAVVHDHPSRDLQVVGTTGTNGKTTISWMLEAAAAADGHGTGMLGTVATRINGATEAAVRTTPEGPDLQRLLATMRLRGVDVVAMEVSSHGLALHRVDGTHFAMAVFTNLSRDHLDFHDTLDDYFEAKARLFTPEFSERAVIGVFDDWGWRMARHSQVEHVTLGESQQADVRLFVDEVGLAGSRGHVVGPAEWLGGRTRLTVTTPLQGRFNLHNAAQALVAATAVGIAPEAAAAGIAAADDVPGRFEVVVADEVTALVDYAHTPEAVAAVVAALRPVTDGRVIVVIGAGGDRDRDKRGPMGAAATAGDVVVFTSDNPRSEDPDAILRELLHGATTAATSGGRTHIEAIADREAAIDRALRLADAGDVVAVLGKGHETGQEVAGVVRDFDDREVLARLWRQVRA